MHRQEVVERLAGGHFIDLLATVTTEGGEDLMNPAGWPPRQYPWDCQVCDIGPWKRGKGAIEGLLYRECSGCHRRQFQEPKDEAGPHGKEKSHETA